jgi:small subunit ribosomal protein S8
VWKVNAVWSDPISDMLTRIRNAVRVRRQYVEIPSSSLKVGIAKVLQEEGYILGYDVIEDTKQGILRIELRYGPRGEDIINKIDRVSRPGRRVYSKVDDLPRVLDGLGTMIVSTSQGVLGDRACREKKVGGEVLCKVY